MEIIATCAAGIEGILGNELKHLGYHANVEKRSYVWRFAHRPHASITTHFATYEQITSA